MVELEICKLITGVGERSDTAWMNRRVGKESSYSHISTLLQLIKKQTGKVSGLCLNHSPVEGDASSHTGLLQVRQY